MPTMMKRVGRIVLLLAGAWVILCGVVYVVQRRLQYFPDRSDPAPAEDGIEDVTLTTADGVRLRAWFWPGTRDTVVLFFHGNAGHRGDRIDWMRKIHALGWGSFMLDYRGYGGSGGSPTEEGLALDADAAVAWLQENGARKLAYFGESLGCGVAVELASRRPPVALVLQSAAGSLVDVGQDAYPFLPIGLLMKDRFDSAGRIGAVRCPVLFIHGARDRVIAIKHGRALFERASEPKEWYEIELASHNDVQWVGGKSYYARIHALLESASS